MLPLAASVAAVAPSVAATTCPQDRCALGELLAPGSAVPARLRESLRLADEMVANWNALTSQCTDDVCMVTNKRIVGEYLSERSPLMRLASEGVLRDPLTLALVVDGDREAYARNARRFESAVGYASSSANLAQFDPTLPTYRKGSYVPKGLKDAQGNLLGTNLENARDFATDARDALLVVCSFVWMGSRSAQGTGDATPPRGGPVSMVASAEDSDSLGARLASLLINVDAGAVQRATSSITAPSWEDIGAMLPEEARALQALRDSGRGPTDVGARLRLFDGTEPRVTLWRDQSAWCPYCHKVVMQLEEKRVPYSVRLAPMSCYSGGALQKPAALFELSKAGKMPVATIDGELYADSASILAAVESTFCDRVSLTPASDAGRRALDDAAALERSFSDAWLVWLTTPPWVPGEAQRAAAFTEAIDAIEAHLLGRDGPYLVGGDFSLADVTMAPFMERAAASCPYYRGLTIRTGGRWPAIERWFEAMESRPAYAALRSDFYTHCLALPPQLSPFGLARTRDDNAERYAAEIDGSDGSWSLPLPRGDRLEPLTQVDDAEARCAAAAALWRSHAQVATLASRGRGVREAVRLPPALAAAILAVVALSVNGAAHGSASQTFQWAATALVMYDILGTRAPLADPRALAATALVPLIDASLRLTAAALLADGSDDARVRDAQRQLRALDADAAEPLRDALTYLRARIGVPRDMDYAAARQLRAHLTACLEVLPSP